MSEKDSEGPAVDLGRLAGFLDVLVLLIPLMTATGD